MRAAVVTGPGSIELREVPVPAPAAGQVRVRLEGCGVCGSHLPLWEGRPWFTYPLEPGAPGHEGWGVVDALGPGVHGHLLGRRVAALSYHAFAEYDVSAADAVVPLPASLEGTPFPGEALACAMNVFRRSGVRAGEDVAVVGVGFLGALLVQLARGAGARVVAVSRRAAARDVARACGADEVLDAADHAAVQARVQERTGARGCACVFEAAGVQETLDLASSLVGVRGRLVIAGYHQDGDRRVDLQSWNWRGLDVINAHEREPAVYVEGMRDAVRAVADGRLNPRPLLTDAFPLAQAGAAMDALRARPGAFLKGWVRA
jgi:threonine dehydrogenase-like Zn-dependent dehydrogenase